jgi:adenylate cyclase
MAMPAPDFAVDLACDSAVVMVVDWVESVRHIERAEVHAIGRWRRFVHDARAVIEHQFEGRVVKSLGDGLLAELDTVRQAVHAALELHRLIETGNTSESPADRIALRIGLHRADVYTDNFDIYGAGVNLAARIATLAGPGETVVSDTVRDGLTDGLDADVEDLGDCFLKHIDRPVRAYRVGGVGASPVLKAVRDDQQHLRPTLAIIPFAMRLGGQHDYAIGELLAEALNVHLGCSGHLRVISRLSTTLFRDRMVGSDAIRSKLDAAYVVSGSYSRDGVRVHLYWELCDAHDQAIVTNERLTITLSDLLDPASEALRTLAGRVQSAIVQVELRRVDRLPLPTLESWTLMLGAVHLLHRCTTRDFERSFQLLSHLIELHPTAVEPRIWMAKWYAERAVQGIPIDRARDAKLAVNCTAWALDREPSNSFALAMDGFVHCHLTQDFDTGDASLREALRLNPSESLAHLFRGVVQGMQGNWDSALTAYAAAAATSPLDPARFQFDSIGAYLCLGAGLHGDALAMAQRSLRANRQHAHTWRVMVIAQVESGDLDGARQSLRRLRSLQPELTVQSYLSVRSEDPARPRFAAALREAGLPER